MLNLRENSGLSEKQRMQQHEFSLLPSAPPDLDVDDGDDEDEEEESLRNVNQGDESHGTVQQNQHETVHHQYPGNNGGNHPLALDGANAPISFFSYNQPTPPQSQSGQNNDNDIDNEQRTQNDHFRAPSSSTHLNPTSSLAHQLFNDEVIDHVPNYMNAENDQLLSQSQSHIATPSQQRQQGQQNQ